MAMKQYLLAVHSDESAPMSDEQMQAAFKAVDASDRRLLGHQRRRPGHGARDRRAGLAGLRLARRGPSLPGHA
jgi:hypothetical protein